MTSVNIGGQTYQVRTRKVDGEKTQILYKDGVGYIQKGDELVPLKKNSGDTWFKKATYSTGDAGTSVEIGNSQNVSDADKKTQVQHQKNNEKNNAKIEEMKNAAAQLMNPEINEETLLPDSLQEVVAVGTKSSVYKGGMTSTDSAGNKSSAEYSFDKQGRKTTAHLSDGSVVEYHYEGDSKTPSYSVSTSPDGEVTRREFDKNGKVIVNNNDDYVATTSTTDEDVVIATNIERNESHEIYTNERHTGTVEYTMDNITGQRRGFTTDDGTEYAYVKGEDGRFFAQEVPKQDTQGIKPDDLLAQND